MSQYNTDQCPWCGAHERNGTRWDSYFACGSETHTDGPSSQSDQCCEAQAANKAKENAE